MVASGSVLWRLTIVLVAISFIVPAHAEVSEDVQDTQAQPGQGQSYEYFSGTGGATSIYKERGTYEYIVINGGDPQSAFDYTNSTSGPYGEYLYFSSRGGPRNVFIKRGNFEYVTTSGNQNIIPGQNGVFEYISSTGGSFPPVSQTAYSGGQRGAGRSR